MLRKTHTHRDTDTDTDTNTHTHTLTHDRWHDRINAQNSSAKINNDNGLLTRLRIWSWKLRVSHIYTDMLIAIHSDTLSGNHSDRLSATYSGICSAILSAISSDILSGIYSDILFLATIVKLFFWTFYLTVFLRFFLTFFLAFFLASHLTFILTFYLAPLLAYILFWHAIWHSIWQIIYDIIKLFAVACTVFDIFSDILSGTYSRILLSGLCWGPGVPTASGAGDARIWRSGPGISGAEDMVGSSGSRRAP